MAIEVEDINLIFSRIVMVITYIGLVVILISSILYMLDINPYVNPDRVVETWHLPAKKFWKQNVGHELSGFYFDKIEYSDMMVISGITILAMAPILGLIAIFFRTRGFVRILCLIAILEFLFAIVRPLIQTGIME
jgi:hypothetical protein